MLELPYGIEYLHAAASHHFLHQQPHGIGLMRSKPICFEKDIQVKAKQTLKHASEQQYCFIGEEEIEVPFKCNT